MWALDKYAMLARNEPNPYDSRADLLAANGNIEEAIANYRKALEVKPDFASSLFKLAAAYVMTDRFASADSCYRALASFAEPQTRSDARASFAYIPARRGKVADALRILDEGIAADKMEGYEKGLVRKHVLKAFLLSGKGDAGAALAQYEKAAAISKKVSPQERLLESVGYVHLLSQKGDFDKAAEAAQRIGRIARDKKEIIFEILQAVSLGTLEFFKGDFQVSSRHYADAWNLVDKYGNSAVKSAYIPFMSGRALLESGKAAEAAAMLEACVNKYYLDELAFLRAAVEAHYYLGIAYERTGNRDKAAKHYEEFLRIWKDADPGTKTVEDAKARLARVRAAG
jgi:tetratricopeptide (TPR) repeat protein